MKAQLVALALLALANMLPLACCLGAQSASFRVQTNGVRVKEPAELVTSYDSAIGDVREVACMKGISACMDSGRSGIRAYGTQYATSSAPRRAAPESPCALGRLAGPTPGPSPPWPAARQAPPSPRAQFGVPLYGGTLIGKLAFLPANADGCKEVKGGMPAGTDILLVLRGCAA